MALFKVTDNIKWPRIDFSGDLKKIAHSIVIPLLREGIETNTAIRGGRFPELEESTKKIKRKKYGHTRPLIAEELLKKSFKGKGGDLKYIVYIAENRRRIAEMLQIEGVGRKGKKFHFMGVTDGMEADANEYMQKKIERLLKNAK